MAWRGQLLLCVSDLTDLFSFRGQKIALDTQKACEIWSAGVINAIVQRETIHALVVRRPARNAPFYSDAAKARAAPGDRGSE